MYGFVYITENLINGKRYIGQRKYRNDASDDEYLGSGKLISLAIEKYGPENFQRTILKECETREELNESERQFIKDFNAVDDPMFYNLATGGEGQIDPSPVIREKLRQSHLGRKHSDEYKQFMKDRMAGENHPMYGKHPSEETRKRQSAAQIKRNMKGENNPWYGHIYTEEEKKRISLALTGRKLSPERIKKAAEAHQIKVLCITNGVVYSSISQAAKELNIDGSSISKVCRGKKDSTKGYVFKYIGKPLNRKSRPIKDRKDEGFI